MAVDRNTILTIHKKIESNSCIVKRLHIRRETVWKVVKKFKAPFISLTDERCNRPKTTCLLPCHQTGQKTNSPNEASGEKYEWKVEKEFTSFCCKNGSRSRNRSNFNASNPQRRPLNQSLQNEEKAWTFNHSWIYETLQMSTHSESLERRHGAQFGVYWWAMPKPPKW